MLYDESKNILTITENGYGKRSSFEGFTLRNRGTKGVICHNINDKTGLLAGIAAVSDDEDMMMVTSAGTLIRTPVKDIPTYSRTAGGVIVMRLADDTHIVNVAIVPAAEENEAGEDEVSLTSEE